MLKQINCFICNCINEIQLNMLFVCRFFLSNEYRLMLWQKSNDKLICRGIEEILIFVYTLFPSSSAWFIEGSIPSRPHVNSNTMEYWTTESCQVRVTGRSVPYQRQNQCWVSTVWCFPHSRPLQNIWYILLNQKTNITILSVIMFFFYFFRCRFLG